MTESLQEIERLVREYGWAMNDRNATASLKSFVALSQAITRVVQERATGPLADIQAERRRQVAVEGWTPEHDDKWQNRELAYAAACYAQGSKSWTYEEPYLWPWDEKWWKPTDRRRDLVKAGALIVAELERLDRAALSTAEG